MRALPHNLDYFCQIVQRMDPIRIGGRVTQVVGLVMESHGPPARLGEICYVYPRQDRRRVTAEVVGFRDNRTLLMPLMDMSEIGPGCSVISTGKPLTVGVGRSLLGRVVNGFGNPLDGKGLVWADEERPAYAEPPSPLQRARISQPLSLGVRAIDALLTCGKGQRLGIFAGSGVGKSTLLGMIARHSSADVNVIALIGERGREVREFIERDLGEDGLSRSVVVVATSDQSALMRLKGALAATAIAEYFRDQGRDVMLMMDSVTRFAWAQREIGLAVGEPPTTRGYTPSVFALLPKVLERSGTSARGTITGVYTVLVEGDDMNEPVADAVRSILDGHVVLSRKLAVSNHYPAIDLLSSVSRLMSDLVPAGHHQAASALREVLAVHQDAEDLINIGAYVPGSNPAIDRARALIQPVREFLRQSPHEKAEYRETVERLEWLMTND
jgi:flagellum-specific ATP synthase